MNKSKLIIIIASIACIIMVVSAVVVLGKGTLYGRYKCPDSTYKLENNRCKKVDIVASNKKLVCPDKYEAKGDVCVWEDSVASKVSYSCDKGYTLDKEALTCNKKTVINRTYIYKCTSGNKKDPNDDTKCLKYTTPKTKQEGSQMVKYCEKGTLSGDNCIQTINANKTLGCPDNYEKTANKTCTKTQSDPAKINRSCDKGYTLDGIKCVKTTTQAGKYEESCNMGYELKDSKCYKNIDIVATKDSIF